MPVYICFIVYICSRSDIVFTIGFKPCTKPIVKSSFAWFNVSAVFDFSKQSIDFFGNFLFGFAVKILLFYFVVSRRQRYNTSPSSVGILVNTAFIIAFLAIISPRKINYAIKKLYLYCYSDNI